MNLKVEKYSPLTKHMQQNRIWELISFPYPVFKCSYPDIQENLKND